MLDQWFNYFLLMILGHIQKLDYLFCRMCTMAMARLLIDICPVDAISQQCFFVLFCFFFLVS